MSQRKKIKYIGVYCTLCQSHIKLLTDSEIDKLKNEYELLYLPCEPINYEVCNDCNIEKLKILITLANCIEEVYG